MRPSGFARLKDFQIYHGDRIIGMSLANCYFAYECPPGTHNFLGIAENKMGLKATLGPDKTYYVVTQARIGGITARMALIPVKRGSKWWDKVTTYQRKLKYISVNEAVLERWRAENATRVAAELEDIYSYLNTPEGQKYVVNLNTEDGR